MKEALSTSAVPVRRFPHIDLLKTLALSFMLVFHCTLYNVNMGTEAVFADYVRMLLRAVLSTCVPLFFFANGYLLLAKPLDLKKHTRRVVRMVVLTSFWILFLLVVMQPILGVSLSWQTVLEKFWSLEMGWNNHLWYMGTLTGIYVFFPLIKQSYDENRKVFYYFTAVCCILCFGNTLMNEFLTAWNILVRREAVVYDGFPFFHIFSPMDGLLGMGMSYFCLGGVMLSLEEKLGQIPAKKRNLLAGAGLVLCCGLLVVLSYGYSAYLKSTWDVVWNGYDTVFTMGSVICLFVLSLGWKKDVLVVRLISQNTLGIYLMHVIIQNLLGKWFLARPELWNVPGSCLLAAAVLAISLVVCLVVKRIPLLRHLI